MIIFLPWPPSANRYWRHPTKGKLAGRHLISEEGRAYRKEVASIVAMDKYQAVRMIGDLSVTIDCYPPDRRRRDIDNLLKALLDAMCKAGLYDDDSQIKRLLMTMRPAPCPHPGVRVEIAQHAPPYPERSPDPG